MPSWAINSTKLSNYIKNNKMEETKKIAEKPVSNIAGVGSSTYFLCSKALIEHFPEVEYSKPFKSGYNHDFEDEYYVAILNWPDIEGYWENIINPYNERSKVADIDFWCRECVPGQMDVSKITLSECRLNGLFVEIEAKIGLTSEKNRAMTIFNLAEKFNCTPIQFINKIVR